jgi:hypothetical protein
MRNERMQYLYDSTINLANLLCLNWYAFKLTRGIHLQTWELIDKIARVAKVMLLLQGPLSRRHRRPLRGPFALANREEDYKIAWNFFLQVG